MATNEVLPNNPRLSSSPIYERREHVKRHASTAGKSIEGVTPDTEELQTLFENVVAVSQPH